VIVATWNVNGIRARAQEVIAWSARAQADVVCLQEIKAAPDQIEEALFLFPEYTSFWHGQKGGYSGVSLHLKKTTFPEVRFSNPAFDRETRIVEAHAGGVTFASVYVPNGGKDYPAKVEFLEALRAHVLLARRRGEPMVVCGDMNVARAEIDVHPSQRDPTVIGQRPQERLLFEELLAAGLVDTSRALDPDGDRLFSWWPYWRNARARNIGWRLDYILASPELAPRASTIERETGASDHAPVLVTLAFPPPSPGKNQQK
jgi:exodeoxyribonuclease-3